jgi:hypothetical protein
LPDEKEDIVIFSHFLPPESFVLKSVVREERVARKQYKFRGKRWMIRKKT